jgi:hypothetical protein
MRILIFALLALAVTACSSAPPQTAALSAGASSGIVAFGTLASFGTFEMDLAPAYTRLAVARHNAARALDKGRITVTVAEDIQADADNIRRALDNARALDAARRTTEARAALDAAQADLDRTERRLP